MIIKNNLLIFIFVIIFCAGTTACTHGPTYNNNNISISKGIIFPLLPSNVFTDDFIVTQNVTISFAEDKRQFIAQIEISKAGMVFAAITDLGQKLLTLNYKNNILLIDQPILLPAPFDTKFLLADLQLTYWPSALLQKHFSRTPLEFLELKEYPLRRIIQRQGRTIIEIEYSSAIGLGSDIIYRHLERNYIIRTSVIETSKP